MVTTEFRVIVLVCQRRQPRGEWRVRFLFQSLGRCQRYKDLGNICPQNRCAHARFFCRKKNSQRIVSWRVFDYGDQHAENGERKDGKEMERVDQPREKEGGARGCHLYIQAAWRRAGRGCSACNFKVGARDNYDDAPLVTLLFTSFSQLCAARQAVCVSGEAHDDFIRR